MYVLITYYNLINRHFVFQINRLYFYLQREFNVWKRYMYSDVPPSMAVDLGWQSSTLSTSHICSCGSAITLRVCKCWFINNVNNIIMLPFQLFSTLNCPIFYNANGDKTVTPYADKLSVIHKQALNVSSHLQMLKQIQCK